MSAAATRPAVSPDTPKLGCIARAAAAVTSATGDADALAPQRRRFLVRSPCCRRRIYNEREREAAGDTEVTRTMGGRRRWLLQLPMEPASGGLGRCPGDGALEQPTDAPPNQRRVEVELGAAARCLVAAAAPRANAGGVRCRWKPTRGDDVSCEVLAKR